MKKVKVGKIDIAYQWDGLEDGPVLMMAHAMGTSSVSYTHLTLPTIYSV